MASNAVWFAQALAAIAATYLIHSTILIGGVWLLLRVSRSTSHALAERLWKSAALLGLLTVPLQLFLGGPSLRIEFTLHSPESAAASPPARLLPSAYEEWRQDRSDLPTIADRDPQAAAVADEADFGSVIPSDGGSLSARADRNEAEPLPDPGSESGIDRQVSLPTDEAPGWIDFDDAEPVPLASILADAPTMLPARPWDGPLWWASLILGTGVALTIVAGIVLVPLQTLSISRRLAGARPLSSGPARRSLNGLIERNARCRRVRLLVSDTIDQPMACGFMRWTIVLPEGTERRLQKDELRGLLAHELAHLVRGDVHWMWIGRLLCSCLAFQPLNFLARRRWQESTEYLCDEWAVGRGVQPMTLARCLTRVAEWRLAGNESAAGLTVVGPKATLLSRVERLLGGRSTADPWNKPLRRGWLSLLALLTAAALVCLVPRVGVPSSAATTPQVDAQPTPARPTLRADWQSLQEELLQLDAELARAHELLSRYPQGPELRQATDGLRQRTQRLRTDQMRLAPLIHKEMER